MRRKVWTRVVAQQHTFIKHEHQSRYNQLRLMEKVFEEMTPRELEKIVQRIERKKEDEKRQTTLF